MGKGFLPGPAQWSKGDCREAQARWMRKALQAWRKSTYLDRIVRWDGLLYEQIPKLVAFVESNGNKRGVEIKGLLDSMDRTRKLLRKHAGVFHLTYGHRREHEWITVKSTLKNIQEAEKLAVKERDEMLSVVVVKKLLKMCREHKAPLKHVKNLSKECAFPADFEDFISRYPDSFRLTSSKCLELVSWDDSLAVTAREIAVKEGRTQSVLGPWAFVSTFPLGFTPDKIFWEEHDKFQMMPFPSPYEEPGRAADPNTPTGEKRVVAVLHELVSLTIEKRLSLGKLIPLSKELLLPPCLDALVACHPRIFYISFKFLSQMVFLREAYQENLRMSLIKETGPLITIRNRYVNMLRLEFREPRGRKPLFSSDSDECDGAAS